MALLELIKTWQLSHQCNGLSLSSVGGYSPHLTQPLQSQQLLSLKVERFYCVETHSYMRPSFKFCFGLQKMSNLHKHRKSLRCCVKQCSQIIAELVSAKKNSRRLLSSPTLSYLIHEDFKPALQYDPRSVALLREIWLACPINSEKPRPNPLPPPEGCSPLNLPPKLLFSPKFL